ncbi:class I SAM-dependent methyltransferase [Paraburkholderia sp. ZP32-5]|uniref:class I SAM-dependent methyltransferase n=1 Tax=Paraburkholderia sp. ZP32-5 TaxID=2883245 RepID=UPI001F2A7533|nr:class I SAM-dependent methyltransferase [Paraburkholderia sp. ZP32-5]
MKGTELDLYATSEPSHALAFNLFDGTWISDVPGYGLGKTAHFEDGRLQWFESVCGGFAGKSALELGPMEGGHTYMLAQAGASPVLAIEANSKCFLKCLLVQNALKFNAEFMYGDFRELLRKREQRFDLILASGVLYHMFDPVALLEDMAYASDSLCIWTHYFDADVVRENRNMATHVDPTPTKSVFRGREIDIHRYSYLDSITSTKFIGGTAPQANWMSRASLLSVLDALDMTVIVGREDRDHPAGPAILLYAAHIPGFSETGYLQRYPDVAAAVEQKQFSSGAEHYIRFGRTEGRLIS